MELELKKAELTAYETGGEVVLTQEETAETIVPDYCPDIARIIETTGAVYLHSRDLRDGKGEISGTVRVTVLYTPEAEGGIRALEFSMPFRCEAEHPLLHGCQYMHAETETELLETRMLNPRKIFTRCKMIVHLQGYRKATGNYSVDLQADPSLGMERKTEKQRVVCLTQIVEKDFTFTDTLNLSVGRDGVAEILSRQVFSSISETKSVGNKLIIKGVVSLGVLYRSTGGKYCSTAGELPFSQIMETEGAMDAADVSVKVQATGCDIQIDGDDPEGRQLAVTVYFHGVAMLRETKELELLSDLYSTAYDVRYEAAPLSLIAYREEIKRRQTVREILEIGVVPDSLLTASVHCGRVTVSREGGTAVLRAAVTVKALYLDEGGAPLKAERSVDVSCSLELPEDCVLYATAACAEEIQGSLSDHGIEVRFPVDFCVEAEKSIKKVCISLVELDREQPKVMAGVPSLVLRCMGKQETAWDLAKKYNTTIAAILAANQVEEEPLPKDRLLLIPRKRG